MDEVIAVLTNPSSELQIVRLALIEVQLYVFGRESVLDLLDYAGSSEAFQARFFVGKKEASPDRSFRLLNKFLWTLLDKAGDLWLPLFTRREALALIHQSFLGKEYAIPSFLAVARFIQERRSPSSLPLGTEIAEQVCSTFSILDFSAWVMDDQGARNAFWREFCTSICGLPDRVANAIGVVEGFFAPQRFFRRLVVELCDAVEAEPRDDLRSQMLAELFSKLCRVGQLGALVSVLSGRLLMPAAAMSNWPFVLNRVEIFQLEKFLLSLLQQLRVSSDSDNAMDSLKEILGTPIIENTSVLVCLEKALCQTSKHISPKIRLWLLAYLKEAPGDSAINLRTILQKLITNWSSMALLQESSEENFFLDLTSTVLLCVRLSPKTVLKEENIEGTIMEGVTGCLRSTMENKRKSGMVVAECVFKKLTPDIPLVFDIKPDEDVLFLRSLGFDEEIQDIYWSAQEINTKTAHIPEMSTVVATEPEEENPDAIVADFSLMPSLDDEEDLPPQNDLLVESTDIIRSVPPPRYLRECLAYLKDTESPEKQEMGLNRLESLIYSATETDLGDMCEELASSVLHLQNDFELDGFDSHRQAVLIALGIRTPLILARLCGNFMVSKDGSFTQKLFLLQSIAAIAKKGGEGRVSVSQEISKTRKLKPISYLDANAEFFDTVLSHASAMIHRYESDLTQKSLIIRSVVSCLSFIVRASGNAVQVSEMTERLFKFLQSFFRKFHTYELTVRISIVLGLHVIVEVLPPAAFAEVFGNYALGQRNPLVEFVTDRIPRKQRGCNVGS
ncbi:telomere length regulation protein-domain-containing protein [Zopfochytrium polystomum]|nr:telomere length regulation protein-domain-containing protein [Zopfochytrium polystomum]